MKNIAKQILIEEILEKYKKSESHGINIVHSDDFLVLINEIYLSGARLATMTAEIGKEKNCVKYLFNKGKYFLEATQEVQNNEYSTIYNIFFNAVFFEREIKDMFGWTAIGNDKLLRLVHHDNMPLDVTPLQKDFAWNTKLDFENHPREFVKIGGPGVFEIPVGPIHAGVIEPGHFRFSLAGERILNIQPMLWFQHKGTEKLFESIDPSKYLALSERISGDMTVSHSLAHAQIVEKLLNVEVPKRAQYLRMIISELERIYNHSNDIGFVGQDTGFGAAGAHGMRLKELILMQAEKLTGSRMMRNTIAYGGVNFDLSNEQVAEFKVFLDDFIQDYDEVIKMLEDIPTMVSRMVACGVTTKKVAKDYGAVGMPARAAGLSMDTRYFAPYDGYKDFTVNIAHKTEGDVRSRYLIRVNEVYESLRIITEAIEKLPEGPVKTNVDITNVNGSAYGITEGWRGEIIHYATFENGKITRCKVKDPSFSNWNVMVPTINGNIIGDFPLINKSFNLSYSGNDL